MIDSFIANHIQQLIRYRRELHQFPELSNKETETARRVGDWLKSCHPDKLVEGLGGTGVCAVFGKSGPAIMFRAELDALPIPDEIPDDYQSQNPEIGHKCGHDGHMTNLLGLAHWFHEHPPKKGRVMLLFQPAEETGDGAAQILADEQFALLKPDAIVALHNLPGYKKHAIILKDDVFAFASIGMIIELIGKTSHSAHPEDGRSPALAVAEIIQMMDAVSSSPELVETGGLITLGHASIGEAAFGITPGKAKVMATVRSSQTEVMDAFTELVRDKSTEIAQKYKLGTNITFAERFESTKNDSNMTNMLRDAALANGLHIIPKEKPFPWSEDFGRFTDGIPGVLFGLGSGTEHPQLHQSEYDYPDELLETAIKTFITLSESFFKSRNVQS